MTGRRAAEDAIDDELRHWRRGDVTLDAGLEFVHLADLARPHSRASVEAVGGSDGETRLAGIATVASEIEGVVVLTQSCDIVRSCKNRPFVEISPLVRLDDTTVEQVRRLKRPAFAFVASMAGKGLVADLDRVMTVEKAVVANWGEFPVGTRTRITGHSRARSPESGQGSHSRTTLFRLQTASGGACWRSITG